MPRTLPPVYSPLSASSIWQGWKAARRPASANAAQEILRSSLNVRGFVGAITLTDSGTSALALAIGLASQGGPVALPAYGCFDLATAVDAAGVPFVLYDVSPDTLAPAPGAIAVAAAGGATAAVVVHLYGLPVDVPTLRKTLPAAMAVVDDAAQGIGATIDGKPVGSLGDYGVLSFGRGKGLTGGGGGAMVVPKDVKATELGLPSQSSLRALLTTTAQWILARPGLYAIPRGLPFLALGETHYSAPKPATRISPFAAGVLSGVVGLVDGELAARRRNAARYRAALGDLQNLAMMPDQAGAGWLRFPVLVAESALPMARDSARLGIMPGYPASLADLDGFGARRQNADDSFPGASTLAQRLFTLPTHGQLSGRDLDAVIAHVRAFG